MFDVLFYLLYGLLYTPAHSTETEIFSNELFKIVFHEILPALQKHKPEDFDKVSRL